MRTALTLMQLLPQILDGGFAVHHFAAPDLIHAGFQYL